MTSCMLYNHGHQKLGLFYNIMQKNGFKFGIWIYDLI